MKRPETILKQIAELESELYSNYSHKEIQEGVTKLCNKTPENFTVLVQVISSHVDEEVAYEEELNQGGY